MVPLALAADPVPAAAEASTSPANATDRPTEPARGDAEVIAAIDRHLRNGWDNADLAPSSPASDGEWCRRVYLDLIGRIPKSDETRAYLADRSPDRRARLVSRLLDSDEYLDEYAGHWATVWTTWLIGRTAGTENNSLVNRAGLEQYLRRSLADNKPYDRLVTELVSAEGCNTPGAEDFQGAVNFLLAALDEQGIQATAKTARMFLGLQVQCTQCHNHPFNTWQQSQFWGLNAFFRQVRPLRTFDGRDIVEVRLADQDFAGEAGRPEQAEIYYELRNGQLEAVFPTFVDGQQINASGFVADVNRRDELARLIVAAETFAPALVNRLWGQMFGYGFTRPVDDLGPHNPPTHPELLAELAADFRRSGYDLRKLLSWLARSEAYGLSSSATERNRRDDPALGEKPRFSHFYLRSLSAEQLYESLLIATQAGEAGSTSDERAARKRDWLRQFAVAFGNDEGGEATTFDGTIPQALMMMNGDLIRAATSDAAGGFLARVAARGGDPGDQVAELYLAALSRPPSRAELALARRLWPAGGPGSTAALQDVWWALLNSNEFIFNH